MSSNGLKLQINFFLGKKEKTFKDSLPAVVKKNLMSLTDEGDTIEDVSLTKSKIRIDQEEPSPNSKKSKTMNFLSNLMHSEKKDENKSTTKFFDKRLLSLKKDDRNKSMLSSPSILAVSSPVPPPPSSPTSGIDDSLSTSKKRQTLINESIELILQNYVDRKSSSTTNEKIEELKDDQKEKEATEKIQNDSKIDSNTQIVSSEKPSILEVTDDVPKIDFNHLANLMKNQNKLRKAIESVKSIK